MEKPRVLGVRELTLEEREPPSEKEYEFLEASPAKTTGEKSFFQKIRAFLRV